MNKWWETDKFYLNLSDDLKIAFRIHLSQKYIGSKMFGAQHAGYIKHCPTCKMMRVTSCSTCGCGNCYTCEHRWCCYGWDAPPGYNESMMAMPLNGYQFDFRGLK